MPSTNTDVKSSDTTFRILDQIATSRPGRCRAVQRAAIEFLLEAGVGCIDDIRGRLNVPTGEDARYIGAALTSLAKQQIIRSEGFIRSKRPEAHRRILAVWRLSSATEARDWLVENPPLPLELARPQIVTRYCPIPDSRPSPPGAVGLDVFVDRLCASLEGQDGFEQFAAALGRQQLRTALQGALETSLN